MTGANKFYSWVRAHPVRSVIYGLLAFCVVFEINNFIYHATKIKDIHDPRFDPMAYRFEDYTDRYESQRILEYIFPIGTPREKVEELLVKKLGAKPYKENLRYANGDWNVTYNVPYNIFYTNNTSILGVLFWPYVAGGRYISVGYDSYSNVKEIYSIVP